MDRPPQPHDRPPQRREDEPHPLVRRWQEQDGGDGSGERWPQAPRGLPGPSGFPGPGGPGGPGEAPPGYRPQPDTDVVRAWDEPSWFDTVAGVGRDHEPWPPRAHEPARRSRHLLGAGIALLALLAGLLGGFVGGRLSRGSNPEPAVLRPVVREVVASGGKSSADQVQAVASGLLPVTVQIRTGEGSRGGTGSGVIMRPDGFIITNNHVVEGADAIAVVLPSSEALEGRLIGNDPANDLAVVKIDRDDLPVANFGRSAELRVGELAVAVGSPFGLQGSVTAGIVSALHRVVEVGRDERLVNAIQTDASINPGNSGGALANGRGQVIGINTAIAAGPTDANVGVGFAIPIDEALEIAADLIAGREVRTPRLGVEGGIDLTPEVAERYGVQGRTGALVTRIDDDGAAARAGMRAGDLVVRIGDDQIHGWDELVVAVRKAEIGQAVPVVVVRQGQELTLQVTPTERP